MLLLEALKKISLDLKNKDFVYSKHFEDRMKDRSFDDISLKKTIKNNELVSFEKQNKNLYKLIYYLDAEKDLILIVNFSSK